MTSLETLKGFTEQPRTYICHIGMQGVKQSVSAILFVWQKSLYILYCGILVKEWIKWNERQSNNTFKWLQNESTDPSVRGWLLNDEYDFGSLAMNAWLIDLICSIIYLIVMNSLAVKGKMVKIFKIFEFALLQTNEIAVFATDYRTEDI